MKKTDLSSFQNKWYKPGARWKMAAWYICNILFFKNPFFPFSGIKIWILRLYGAKMGKGVVIKPVVNIKYPWKLSVGDFTWIGEKVWIDNLDEVTVGKHCCISQGALLLCGNHNYKKSSFDLIIKPINIEDGAWIGAQSTVCQGVTVGNHAVLSVGSVISKNMDPYSIYTGVPAQKVRERKIEE